MRLFASLLGALLLAAASAGAAAAAHAAPYVRGPIDNARDSSWRMTPPDASRFPAVPGPAGAGAVGLLTAPFGPGPNPQSVMAARWVHPELAHAGWQDGRRVSGQDTWYRVRMMFPAGRYVPTRGEWNWLAIWHDDDRTASFPGANSIALGVFTDFAGPKGSPGQNPRLVLRLMGGRVRAPSVRTIELPRGSLMYDHWYDLTFHFVWSADGRAGLAEWWCDGTQVGSLNFPTLYTLPDGSHSYNSFGVYNYRLRSRWPSEVDVSDVAIGPDAVSVGARLVRMDAPSVLFRRAR